jgi:hypothetical protein
LIPSTKGDEPQGNTASPHHFEPALSPTVQVEVSQEWFSKMPSLSHIADELEQMRGYAFHRWGLVLQRPGISIWREPLGAFRILVRGMEAYADEDGCQAREWSDLGACVRECVDRHKVDLLDDGATRRALDYVEKSVPDLVSGVVPSVISLTQFTAVLRALLREEVTTRHMNVILQTIAECGGKVTERGLVAEVRAALAPVICSGVAVNRQIQGVAIEPLLDLVLARSEESGSLISGDLVDAICSRVSEVVKPGAVLLASKRSRAYLRDIVNVRGPEVKVLALEELSPRFEVVPAGSIELVREADRAVLAESVM